MIAVDGVGAVVEAVPPVAVVYHCKVLLFTAVAFNAEDEAYWQ